MASGDRVVEILEILPPSTDYAIRDVRQGGSTPPESVLVFDFADGEVNYMDFLCSLNGYAGGGLTLTIVWSAETAASGVVRWEIAIRRMQDDGEDIDGSHTYDFNAVDDTAPSASGEVSYADITFSDGADMDSWADGELAIVRLSRNGSHANDTMTDTAELWALSGKET